MSDSNIKPNDLPSQYQVAAKTLQKGVQEIFRIIMSTDADFSGQAKASRMSEVHLIMQEAVTNIEALVAQGISDTEDKIDAVIEKPFVPPPEAPEETVTPIDEGGNV